MHEKGVADALADGLAANGCNEDFLTYEVP